MLAKKRDGFRNDVFSDLGSCKFVIRMSKIKRFFVN
jgi:hypothetical protein